MREKRNFSKEFKRKVVEEWVAGEIRPAQLSRKYEISPGLLYHWKRQYSRGKYDNEPATEALMAERIKELERMVGRLTMENDLLKKAMQLRLKNTDAYPVGRNGNSSARGKRGTSGNGARS